jgi:hypothetical protein
MVRIIEVSLEVARGERTAEQFPRQIAEVGTEIGWAGCFPLVFITERTPKTSSNSDARITVGVQTTIAITFFMR